MFCACVVPKVQPIEFPLYTADLLFPMELIKVLRTLEPVVGNWKMLGLELGLSCNVLDTIESDCHTILERKMRMIQRWMSTPKLCPSWCTLVKAFTEHNNPV